jgi:hypothetical protein
MPQKSSSPRKSSPRKKSAAKQDGSLRLRRGYTYVHPRSGKKVVVPSGYVQNRSLKPEGSVAYQAERAAGQRRRASASKKSGKCAGAPTAAACARKGQVLRDGTVYERADGTHVVRCASCVKDEGRKGKAGPATPKIYVESGTLYPYELKDDSASRRRGALSEAVERLAQEHKEQNPSLGKSEALRLAANTARAKLQVLSQYRKNASEGTVQGEQCVRALHDEDWLRGEYGLNALDWNNRICFGTRGGAALKSTRSK